MIYLKAFLVGGIICGITQIFIDKTKLMPGRIMVSLVVIGTILGAIGWYEPLIDFAGAGASVPLSSFGNSLFKGVKEAVDEQGFVGIFTGGFKAGAVGISSALIFGYLASLIFKPRMKD
jgi:stage V sporulation protein AE